MKHIRLVGTLLFVIAAVSGAAFAQATQVNSEEIKPATVQDATAKLRYLFFNQDSVAGTAEGRKFIKRFGKSAELKAWFILNMAASDEALEDAVKEAERTTVSNPNEPWGWFALAGALNYDHQRGAEALAASEKALSKQPHHPDFIWLRAESLRRQMKYHEAIDLVEKGLATVERPAHLLVAKATALYYLSFAKKGDPAKAEAALVVFAAARKADPLNVNAHYLPGFFLTGKRRSAEGCPLLRKAIALSPASGRVHQAYWQCLSGLTNLSQQEKRAQIEADINDLLARRGNHPGTLVLVAGQYGELKLATKQKEFEDRILRNAPNSRQAEWVLVDRYRRFEDDASPEERKDPKHQEAYRRMLRHFINRPHHHQETLLGDAYRSLFLSIAKDPSVKASELLDVINSTAKYDRLNVHISFGLGAVTLAERKVYFREAESLARAGIVEARKKVDSRRKNYETEGDYVRALNSITGIMQDALGWVFFNEGRHAEAEKELLQAYELNPKHLSIPYHLGRLYEVKQDWQRAEESYIKGAMLPTTGENPSKQGLKDLYEKRHGKLDGYPEYLAKIADFDRSKRREKIMASRISAPKLVRAFDLKTLSGESVSLESLRGKIVVINFWGVWCGWCVAEMPDFQKLSDKYKSDPEVAILTINNDLDREIVTEWMKKQNYNFGILLDNGYVNDASIRSFPTTWFLDKEGRLTFSHSSWSEKLLEEFSWRVEELRNPQQRNTTSASIPAEEAQETETPDGDPLTVATQIESSRVSPGNHAQLAVTIKVASGYHINANKPDNENLIPTVLRPRSREGVVWGTPIYPRATSVVEKFSPAPLKVYNGNVVIRVPLTISAPGISGQATVSAELQVQACNSEKCLPPRKIAVSAVVPVTKETSKR